MMFLAQQEGGAMTLMESGGVVMSEAEQEDGVMLMVRP